MSEQAFDRVPVIEVIVTEELDFRAVPRLDARLAEALELRPAQLVVDLAACPRMDAAAIGLLVEVHRRVRRAGGVLTLRAPSARLRRNLELARADRVLRVTAAPEDTGERSRSRPLAEASTPDVASAERSRSRPVAEASTPDASPGERR